MFRDTFGLPFHAVSRYSGRLPGSVSVGFLFLFFSWKKKNVIQRKIGIDQILEVTPVWGKREFFGEVIARLNGIGTIQNKEIAKIQGPDSQPRFSFWSKR